MEGIHRVRERLHSKILRLRSVEGMVSSFMFERLWEDSDDAQKDAIIQHINNGNRSNVSNWIKHHKSLAVEELSSPRLKDLAYKLRIPYWSRLSKVELIAAVKGVEDAAK